MSDDTDDIDLLMGVLDSAMDPNPVSVEPEPPTVLQEEAPINVLPATPPKPPIEDDADSVIDFGLQVPVESDPVLDAVEPEPIALSPQPSVAPEPVVNPDDAFAIDLSVTVPAKPAPVVESDDNDFDMGDFVPPVDAPPAAVVARRDEGGADEADTIEMVNHQREVPNITKPWMKHHKFTMVTSIQQVHEIVDAAIEHGSCALDTETEGLDTRIFYDAEGKPRTKHQIVGYCISVDGVEGFYIPIRHIPEDGGKNLNLSVAEVSAEITRLCLAAQPTPNEKAREEDPLAFVVKGTKDYPASKPGKVKIYFWNAKFDQEMLYPVTGIDFWHPESFEDGLLACFCYYSADKSLGLKDKAFDLLADPDGNPYEMIELKELFIRGRPIKFGTLAPDEEGVLHYACADAICTYLLCEPPRPHEKNRVDYLKKVRESYSRTYRIEKQVIQADRVMERPRVKLNRKGIQTLLDVHEAEYKRLDAEIRGFAKSKGYDLDPSSTKQLSDFLFTNGKGCLNLEDKPDETSEGSGQYKTDAETLEEIASGPHAPPILKWVLGYRKEEKTLGTYLRSMLAHLDNKDELRFGFKETGAATGRFSAPGGKHDHGYSGIPIHGIPGESDMRKLFMARDGYTFVKCDYAGQELRIVANISGEPVWIKEFLEGKGDLHTITARAFFNKDEVTKEERGMGKTANFALVYGGGPQAIMRATGCDKNEGARRKQAFDKSVPTFAAWIKVQHASVKKNLGITNPFGRWIAIPDAASPDPRVRGACERHSTNYPIQSSGSDIMKISLVTLCKEFNKRGWLRNGGDDSVRMLLTVHDEIVFEIKHERVVEAVPVIVEIMERPSKMLGWKVPLVTEPLVGPNWGTGYKCERYKEGKTKIGEGDVLANGFVYGITREVDLGKDTPGEGEVEHSKNIEKKKVKIRIVDPAWLRGVSSELPPTPSEKKTEAAPKEAKVSESATSIPAEPSATEIPSAAQEPVSTPVSYASYAKKDSVAVITITRITDNVPAQVREACLRSLDPDGMLLELHDSGGASLILPSDGFRIDPKKLVRILDREYNINNEAFTPKDI